MEVASPNDVGDGASSAAVGLGETITPGRWPFTDLVHVERMNWRTAS